MKPSHVWEACLRTQPNSPSVIAVYCQIAKISLNVEYDYCSAVERICFCCTHEGPARARRQAGLAKIQPASVTPWKESACLSACPFGREGSRALDQTKDPSSLVHSFYPVTFWGGPPASNSYHLLSCIRVITMHTSCCMQRRLL